MHNNANYRPRLHLSTSDFLPQGADCSPRGIPFDTGASMHWLTHYISGHHLLIVSWIDRQDESGLAIAVLDEHMCACARHFMPCKLPDDPTNQLQRLKHALMQAVHLHIVREDADGLRATLVLQQPAERHYPGDPLNPVDGGMTLLTYMADWFALEIDFSPQGGAQIRLDPSPRHHESQLSHVSSVAVGDRRYWLGSRARLTDRWDRDNPDAIHRESELQVALDEQGLPGAWRSLDGGKSASVLASKLSPWASNDYLHCYDATHAVALLRIHRVTRLCLLDLHGARMAHSAPIRIAHGHWKLHAWRVDANPAGGDIWLHANNEKHSAKHRDLSLWRVRYGARASSSRSKRKGIAVTLERLTDDRVVTSATVLDFAEGVLALWHHGMGVKHVEPTRCQFYSNDESADQAVQSLPTLPTQLPQTGAYPVGHFGRMMERPSHPRLPELGFSFADRRLLVYESLPDGGGFPIGYELAEIDF